MDGDDLIGIGAFSLLTGISISALRHYAEVGVLAPAHVDPDSGYRYYRPDQAPDARLLRALREVDLPIERIRAIAAERDETFTRDVLASHRRELADRGEALGRMITRLDHLIERGTRMPTVASSRIVQVKIHVDDLSKLVSFYESALGASYDESISSLTFGTYPDEQFFLITLDEPDVPPARFGLVVEDVDAAHAQSIVHGAEEVYAPVEVAWKPRCSRLADPSGNVVDLYQG